MLPLDPGNLRDFIIACVIVASLWGGIRFAHRSERCSRVPASGSERPGQLLHLSQSAR
jgi:hypothetical protein